ncbi:hypothetical protein DKG77_11545 [Flagellimonas aquimarina]|uniref:Uncharacterized protein n=1 Tax=Flagellimonas aquimarina TaxID=2201895 RepID=A0A316L1J7_9FLAO|nr:hypothetical protein [Allomuricauda koreensis]PWL38865.1 hypothetical protein DKG77_11545 [Allomuricauda koreensis]
MKSIKQVFTISILLFALACSNDDYGDNPKEPELNEIRVIGRGVAIAQPKTIVHPKTGETLEPNCFLMELIDADSGNVIGTLQDCVVDNVTDSVGTILSRVITSISIDGRGTIQAENQVIQTLQPPDEALNFKTLFTPTKNNIIKATFEFEGREGTVALDGEVSLANFDQGIVSFNCNFTINFESN